MVIATRRTLDQFARQLRHRQTDAEERLWDLLRGRRFSNLKFRRQHPVAGYVLDFFCHEIGLAIELDGGQHAEPEQETYDLRRTQVLRSYGIRVLRFWNHDVLRQPDTVLAHLQTTIGALRSSLPSAPSPGR